MTNGSSWYAFILAFVEMGVASRGGITMNSMFSAEMLDHFQNPRNAGVVENPDVSVQLENPACGDVLRITMAVARGRVSEIRFQAKGCVPAMACGSALAELVQGKTISQVASLTRDDLITRVGGLPAASEHAAHLAMDTLAQAISTIPAACR